MQIMLTRNMTKSLPLVSNGRGAVHIARRRLISTRSASRAAFSYVGANSVTPGLPFGWDGVNTTQTRSCLGRVFCFEHLVARARLNRWTHHQLYLAMHRFQWILYGIISKCRH